MSIDGSWRRARSTALIGAFVIASVGLTASPATATSTVSTATSGVSTVGARSATTLAAGSVSAGFEDGDTQGWAPRLGSETLAVTDADAHSGTHSLLITQRQSAASGPALNVLNTIAKRSTYTFSTWVKLAPGQPATTLRLSLERRSNGTAKYDGVSATTPVTADGWARLTGSYTLTSVVDFLTAYVESANGTASFYLDDFELTPVELLPIQTDIPVLKDVLANDFVIGTAVDGLEIEGAYGQLAARHFASVTPGNALKWESTERTEGQFSWERADIEVGFGVDHGLKVRGHTLAWHSQTPAWVFQRPDGTPLTSSEADKALLLSRLETHIRAVVGRYQDRAYAWDVVNEIIDSNQPDGLRRSRWYEISGLDYVRTAFRVAHEVAPKAELFINDYGTEQPAKREALFKVVSQLLAEGVPVSGVGHQAHLNVDSPPVSNLEATIQRFVPLGLDQQITELDVSAYSNSTDTAPVSNDVITNQGHRYRDLFDMLRRQKAHVSAVTLWGASDGQSWLRSFPIVRADKPLLFDDQLQAKPAFWGIVDPSKLAPLVRKMDVPQASPKVDGNRDAAWQLTPGAAVQGNTGGSATVGLRWDSKRLYVLADVSDKTVNRADTVDVTVDGVQYRWRRGGSSTPGLRAALACTATGYRLELAVPLVTAGQVGAQLPLRVTITDAARSTDPMIWTGTATLVDPIPVVDAVRGAPVLDGVVDPIWQRAPAVTTNVRVTGADGAIGTTRLLWDDTHLYILVTVSDPNLDGSNTNPWEQDSVELFVDPDNSKGAAYDSNDGQYRVSFANRQSVGGAPAANLTSATATIPRGYVVEAAIALSSISPAVGRLVGFDVQVNDATAGARTGVTTWHDPTGRSYIDTSRWGVVRLVRR
jgi:endo-1,4-beta-xylanase